jgi:cytidine deaminase
MPADAATIQRALDSLASKALREALRPAMEDGSFSGVIPFAEAQELAEREHMSMSQLMMALVPLAQAFAKPVISNFKVGAVAQGSTSRSLYFGANMEFVGAALSFTTHAEQAAVTNAWLNGEQGIAQLAIDDPPCGYCRQFLWEITTAEEMEILLAKGPRALKELLPEPFGPENLEVKVALMGPTDNELVLDAPTEDPAIRAALDAANASYAPSQYSGSYAGVAVYTQSNAIYAGRYAENAAFNPSMSPLESALTMWNLATFGSDPILRVVLVQIDGARADQTSATAALVDALSAGGQQVVFEVCGAHRV